MVGPHTLSNTQVHPTHLSSDKSVSQPIILRN